MNGSVALRRKFDEFKQSGLSLDMTRGKPCVEQLDLSASLVNVHPYGRSGKPIDTRNYGCLEGLPEARELFGEYLGVSPSEILVQGNSSLALMHDTIVQALLRGFPESDRPWGKIPEGVAMLCPIPGYDRHFGICERYGIRMIPVAMNDDGPDMDEVEHIVRHDANVKGIWCVPKYSNPTGAVYSEAVVDRLARMPSAASDFRIIWDNAYAVHHLGGGPAPLKNILDACTVNGYPNRPLVFGSTSKITFAGAGVAMIAGNKSNMEWFKDGLRIQTIGPDKMNQMRHVHFLPDMPTILNHMDRHAAILKPKFDLVLEILDRELSEKGIAGWSRPNGGYFINVNVVPGCAKATVALAREAGLQLTEAGATFPHGLDPLDSNIRIAPTFPPIEELRKAVELFAICAELAVIEQR